MSRDALISALEAYRPSDETERGHVQETLELLKRGESCFYRHDFPGHIVGGGWLVSCDGTKVLLTRHKYLNRWLQFGGHADGETDILAVALQETLEESGVKDFSPALEGVFDVDVHPIPANPKKDEPAHMHYELRYLLRANDDTVIDPECEVKWLGIDEVLKMDVEPAMQRMVKKWQEWLAAQ